MVLQGDVIFLDLPDGGKYADCDVLLLQSSPLEIVLLDVLVRGVVAGGDVNRFSFSGSLILCLWPCVLFMLR